MSGLRIAFIGAGAVGAPAALLLAKTLPQASITVFDAGLPPLGDRTFVLAGSTWECWRERGVWQQLEDVVHPLRSIKANFSGSFGSITMSGEDCQTDCFARTVSEVDFLASIRSELKANDNVSFRMPAEVTGLATNGQVRWQEDGMAKEERFDLVAVAGLKEDTLAQIGFSFASKSYKQLALVSTIDGPPTGAIAYERFLQSGAATTVPRRDCWSHILILDEKAAKPLQEMADEDYLDILRKNRWINLKGDLAIRKRGCFPPRKRIAQPAGLGQIVLLGPTACMVSPVGAQELNLGLRDGLALATMLAKTNDTQNLASSFAAQRAKDRETIANITDIATRFVSMDFPGKLPCAGVFASAIDLLPRARGFLLSRAVFRNGY